MAISILIHLLCLSNYCSSKSLEIVSEYRDSLPAYYFEACIVDIDKDGLKLFDEPNNFNQKTLDKVKIKLPSERAILSIWNCCREHVYERDCNTDACLSQIMVWPGGEIFWGSANRVLYVKVNKNEIIDLQKKVIPYFFNETESNKFLFYKNKDAQNVLMNYIEIRNGDKFISNIVLYSEWWEKGYFSPSYYQKSLQHSQNEIPYYNNLTGKFDFNEIVNLGIDGWNMNFLEFNIKYLDMDKKEDKIWYSLINIFDRINLSDHIVYEIDMSFTDKPISKYRTKNKVIRLRSVFETHLLMTSPFFRNASGNTSRIMDWNDVLNYEFLEKSIEYRRRGIKEEGSL